MKLIKLGNVRVRVTQCSLPAVQGWSQRLRVTKLSLPPAGPTRPGPARPDFCQKFYSPARPDRAGRARPGPIGPAGPPGRPARAELYSARQGEISSSIVMLNISLISI